MIAASAAGRRVWVAIGNLRCEDGSAAGRPGCDRSVDAVLTGNRPRLVGSWVPSRGFVPAAAPGDPPPWRPTHLSERQGAFSLDANGRVLERNEHGAYAPAGVTLPGVDPAIPVPRFVAAASPTLLAACAQPRDDVPYSCRAVLRG